MSKDILTIGETCVAIGADPGDFATSLEIPVISGRPQAQGDLAVIPHRHARATTLLPPAGEVIVVGRGGHAHALATDSLGVCWDFDGSGGQILGVLTVPAEAVVFLFHSPVSGPRRLAEHAPLAIGPGRYEIRRQREESPAGGRLVAD